MTRGVYRLDRAAIFTVLPAAPAAITAFGILDVAGLGREYVVALRSCLHEWRSWGAVRSVRHGAGRENLWSRLWTAEELARHVAQSRGGRAPQVVDAPEATTRPAARVAGPVDSLATLCAGQLARPVSLRAR
jgi:hypothetical protein